MSNVVLLVEFVFNLRWVVHLLKTETICTVSDKVPISLLFYTFLISTYFLSSQVDAEFTLTHALSDMFMIVTRLIVYILCLSHAHTCVSPFVRVCGARL